MTLTWSLHWRKGRAPCYERWALRISFLYFTLLRYTVGRHTVSIASSLFAESLVSAQLCCTTKNDHDPFTVAAQSRRL
ncbi:hypothetical protein ACQKWADRAFT_301095, partial [Trichoderma austrokoningii]